MSPTPPAFASGSRHDLLSLAQTSHEHQDRIEPHVDRLATIAGMIGRATPSELAAAFDPECAFVIGQLVPHMEAIEATLYGDLERLMDRRHSMAPMREEHEQLVRLFESLCRYRSRVAAMTLTEAESVGLRRVLYRLHAILRVHLAEEELYLRVLDHNLSAEEKDLLARGIDHAVAEPL